MPAASPSVAAPGADTAAPRTLVLVTGSSRSATSAMAGALRELGLRVRGPYLHANRSDPRGSSSRCGRSSTTTRCWKAGVQDAALDRLRDAYGRLREQQLAPAAASAR